MANGKIIKALSGFYYVLNGEKVVRCRGRGVFRKQKISPLVGDYVEYQLESNQEGYILSIEKRKNELIRPPIANVDQAILVFSVARPNFHLGLLDRFLVLIESKAITPIICLTKMDLLSPEDEQKIHSYCEDYREIGYQVITTSVKNGSGLDQIRAVLQEKTSVFAGQSGVGKSSLLNALRPDLQLETKDISDSLGRGKHTTRHVELIEIDNGLVADTPGFSSLELGDLDLDELSSCFPEIHQLSQYCKFRGCRHLNEPKCAVREAVEMKKIPAYRYDHYQQFLVEIKERKPRY
ncbi:ribosome small subunit-dependent GTPase A [Bacillus smithii]|uniref:ribosome small subunit-dependent GTPase A n=1 Tax=Bacillus smithii TaxID=1479 RepID=UPI002E1D8102|nr:ribosome small subunit-dependent GTPase A [Bacillus smithii]